MPILRCWQGTYGSGLGDQCISVEEPFNPLGSFGSSSQSRLNELTRENGLFWICADDDDPEGLSTNMEGMMIEGRIEKMRWMRWMRGDATDFARALLSPC